MPHAGLMDGGALGPEGAPLQRARLHLRGARRRLRQGKTGAGLAALYDSLTSGVDWFLATPAGRARVGALASRDDAAAYGALAAAGVVDRSLDFDAFQRLVYQGLDGEVPGADPAALLRGVEAVLAQLGVLPFDEDALPPEDPATP